MPTLDFLFWFSVVVAFIVVICAGFVIVVMTRDYRHRSQKTVPLTKEQK